MTLTHITEIILKTDGDYISGPIASHDQYSYQGGVFSNSWDNLTSVGLNKKVCSNISALHDNGIPLFTWQRFRQTMRTVAKHLGTLNGTMGDSETLIPKLDPMRHNGVWLDYDAYFRGINVYCGDDAIKERVPELNINDSDEFSFLCQYRTCLSSFLHLIHENHEVR